MFMVLGLGFDWKAASYQMGTAARIGPGYFPFALGLVLAILGAIVLLGSLAKGATETHVEKFDWRITFLVIGSVILYGLILKLLGIYISVFVLVVVSSLASHEFNLKVAAANGVFLVVF